MSTAKMAENTGAAASEQRRHRAAVAQRLVDLAPAAVDVLDWDALDQAPAWLSLPEAAQLILQARIGALLYAPELRLWIDGPRLAAARALLGDAVLDDLLTQPEAAMPRGLVRSPRIDHAGEVAAQLRSAGLAVLLAAMPPGLLRAIVIAATGATAASAMSAALAASLIARGRALGQGGAQPHAKAVAAAAGAAAACAA
ncbi:hypothetical protein [Aquabacterium sp.]|uniref:hypothetical protein n=1 Tax=Aquabacterium sp. TaxID=1872578 RepID=UPI002BF3ADB2|nr:hypothetical protein [Aquabacterium sp.]HSW05252.1 hypothetical protein [Aquabacterium sp.]